MNAESHVHCWWWWCAPTRKRNKGYESKGSSDCRICSNSTGTCKVPPLIIGTSKQPHYFRDARCPLPYIDQKIAWMDKERYKHWWFNVFLPCIREFTTEKVALLTDSCSGHDKTITDPLGQVECFFSTKHDVHLSAFRPGNNCCDQDALQDSYADSDGQHGGKFWWTSSRSWKIAQREERDKLRTSGSCVRRSKFTKILLGWNASWDYICLLTLVERDIF